MPKNNKAAGTARELRVVHHYRAAGYIAFRTPASLGVCDVVAMKLDPGGKSEVLFIEVKANYGSPYKTFSPNKREELHAAALIAGADAYLCHWPPRGEMKMIHESQWP